MEGNLRDVELVNQFCRVFTHSKKKLPIRSSEMGLLIFVALSEYPPTSTDAVLFFKVSPPTVAIMVNALIKGGYLTKGPYLGDARRFTLLLTGKATKLIRGASKEYFKNMMLLKQGLGHDGYDTLLFLLEKANRILLAQNK